MYCTLLKFDSLPILFRKIPSYHNVNMSYILEWNTNLGWVPKQLAEIWGESSKCLIRNVFYVTFYQISKVKNSVEKSMKWYNGEIISATHKVCNDNFPCFPLRSSFAIFPHPYLDF